MSGDSSTRICQLAAIISDNTYKFDKYISTSGQIALSFDKDTPTNLEVPKDNAEARDAVMEASEELQALMLGPLVFLYRQTINVIEADGFC